MYNIVIDQGKQKKITPPQNLRFYISRLVDSKSLKNKTLKLILLSANMLCFVNNIFFLKADLLRPGF